MTTPKIADVVEAQLPNFMAAKDENSELFSLYDRVLHEVERPLIVFALTECKGNQLRAAELLGMNRNTLRKKIRDLGIPTERDHYRKAA